MENYIIIKIGKKDVPFKFTMRTLEMICEKAGMEYYEFVDYSTKKPFGALNTILLCANAVYNKGKEVTVYDVDDWLEEMTEDDLVKVWGFFQSSMINMTQKLKALNEGNTKKK